MAARRPIVAVRITLPPLLKAAVRSDFEGLAGGSRVGRSARFPDAASLLLSINMLNLALIIAVQAVSYFMIAYLVEANQLRKRRRSEGASPTAVASMSSDHANKLEFERLFE